MNHHPTTDSCPHCRETFTAHSGANTEDPPAPGDLSVCAFCGGLMKLNMAMKLIKLPAIEEIRVQFWDPEGWKVIKDIRSRIRKRKEAEA